ncbi:EndoS/ChiA family endoglycosidase [Lacticaseibacillus absianus]|uniref:EndoS/ChiA family endoglycosidase n=1 Tax=Lacticaseibacillus absianus TaxID=2729623 RepID=UPI0015C8209D|nr:LPXTG cell wall anchor domain-containing protein [Lacticaseibacillus absianus]
MKQLGNGIKWAMAVVGIGLAIVIGLTLGGPQRAIAAAAPNDKTFMVYYRAWRDKTMKGVNTDIADPNTQTMLDLPEGIDIVNVFSYVPGGQEKAAAPFFEALKTTYAPELHKRGVKLVRALGYGGMLSDWRQYYAGLGDTSQYTAAQEQAAIDAWAKQEVETLSGQYGLDGLDIDMEEYPSTATAQLSDRLINALSQYIGPKANNGTLFIYDSNGSNMVPFKNVVSAFSYVGYQQYGSTTSRTVAAAKDYAAVGFDTRHFLAGLTFPEEGDHNRWYDTNPADFTGSHTHQEAEFIAGSDLGGMFMYAVDRDGRTYSQEDLNHVMPTTYRWTKTAIAEIKGYTLAQVQAAARQHVERVGARSGWSEDTIKQTNAAIDAAQNVFEVYSAFMSDDYATSLDPSFDALKEIANPLGDIEALQQALTAAQALVSQVAEPTALQAAIRQGQAVLDTAWASVADVNAATAALNAAIAAAKDALAAAQAKADYQAGYKAGQQDGLAGAPDRTAALEDQSARYRAGYVDGYKAGATARAQAQADGDKKQPKPKPAGHQQPTVKPKQQVTKRHGAIDQRKALPQTGAVVNVTLMALGAGLIALLGAVARKRHTLSD